MCKTNLGVNFMLGGFFEQNVKFVRPQHPDQLFNPSRTDPGRREKINLNLYFHTSLWCFKRFYEGLKGLHKTFWGTTNKCENKNLS